jgi:glyoxylase-like metal-dependent hydrolase (beta-lactamase superfamily II)
MHAPITRRHFLATSSLAAAAIAVSPRSLFAQTDPVAQMRAAGRDAKVTTQPLRGGVSALIGAGGNIAVLPGRDGKVIIDSGYATAQPQIIAALDAISSDQINHLINTHWHFDHTDGNGWMHTSGAKIHAHVNTLKRLSTSQTNAFFGVTFPPAPAGALPTETFTDTRTLLINDITFHLAHYAPAHTDSDISIYFTQPDILHVGDTWFNGFYPFIDYGSGGSIDGMIHAANRNLMIVTRDTMIIPGHGPIGNKPQLAEFRDVLTTARDKVAALKKQGLTLEAVIAAKPMAAYDAKWGAGFMQPPAFLGLVYQGV